MKVWVPHPPMYSHLPSLEISRPFAPAASLPGTFFHPVPVCHSQTSPLISPAIIRSRAAASVPRGKKLEVMNPPSDRPITEFRPSGSGATAQPIQVNTGALGRASNSKTSIDSLRHGEPRRAYGRRSFQNADIGRALNSSPSEPIGPGQDPYFSCSAALRLPHSGKDGRALIAHVDKTDGAVRHHTRRENPIRPWDR